MLRKHFLTILCFAYIFRNAISKRHFGPCKNDIAGMENFEPDKYTGQWFELEVPALSIASTKKCSFYELDLTADNIFNVTYVTYGGLLGIESSDTYPITLINSNMSHPKNIKMDIMLGTDYENYAVFYYCKNILLGLTSEDEVRVLGRHHMLNEASQAAVNRILEKYDYSTVQVDQKDCDTTTTSISSTTTARAPART